MTPITKTASKPEPERDLVRRPMRKTRRPQVGKEIEDGEDTDEEHPPRNKNVPSGNSFLPSPSICKTTHNVLSPFSSFSLSSFLFPLLITLFYKNTQTDGQTKDEQKIQTIQKYKTEQNSKKEFRIEYQERLIEKEKKGSKKKARSF